MAEDLDDAKFWLPSEFLADDFFLESESNRGGNEKGEAGLTFPCEQPYGFGSNPNSPVESVTETESDEEERLDGLTLQMACSFLQDDGKDLPGFPRDYTKAMARSPQSTLCGVGGWSFSGRDPPSQVSSPPSPPLEQPHDDAWDLLYAAAGQVVRVRQNNEGLQHSVLDRGLLGPPRNRSPQISAPPKNSVAGVHSSPGLSQQQLQATQFYQLRRQQQQQSAAAWGRQARARVEGGYGEVMVRRTLGLPSSAWPPLQKQQQQHQQQQPQPGSGMRSFFPNGTGLRRESTGTGVFLPRRVGIPNESRRKSACPTVLPARVVKSFNLDLNYIAAQPRLPSAYLDHDAAVAHSKAYAGEQQKRYPLVHPQPAAVASHEIRLPTEWTY